MQRKGPAALSDFELLEVLIGSGNGRVSVGQISQNIQRVLRRTGPEFSLQDLSGVAGVGDALACKMAASIELSRRYLVRSIEPLRSTRDILARLDSIRDKRQEYFVVFSLDGGHRLIEQRTVTIGTLDTVLAHPREVFADAVADRAASIAIAHNHPSGNPEPSAKDRSLTNQLIAAGQLLGIPLRDHVIVTKDAHFSFRQHHLIAAT